VRRVLAVLVVLGALLPVGVAAPTVAAAAPKVQWHTISFVLGLPKGAAKDASTVADARAAISNVDGYYRAVSRGRVRFRAGRVVSWTRTSTRCTLRTVSAAATSLRLPMNRSHHVVMYQPVNCGFGGLADRQGRRVILGAGSTSSALAHELGHNLGLGHSNSSGCTVAFSAKACARRTDVRRMTEYGDGSDLMGGSDRHDQSRLSPVALAGALGPLHLRALRLLPDRRVRHVNPAKLARPRTVSLVPAPAGTGIQAVTLPWKARTLSLSYLRPAAGSVHGRVLVQTPSGAASLLLPVSARGEFSGPLAGSTYRVGARVVMEVLSTSAARAVLRFRRVSTATPTAVAARAGVRSATVTWRARPVPGLSGYEVRMVAPARRQGDPPQVVSVTVAGAARAAAVPGLAPDVLWRPQVIPLVSGGAAPAGVSAALRTRPDPSMLPTFPVVDVQAAGTVRVDWAPPPDPAVVLSRIDVTVRVDRDLGWTSQSSSSLELSGSMVLVVSGPGLLSVTALATYPSGETYRVVLRSKVKVG
jgi:Metallo-peptidase family M12B Reprolysin-like